MQLDALREELGLGLGFVSMSHIASTVGQGSNCFTAILFGSLAVMGLAGADLWFRALSGVLDTCFRHLSTHWNKVLRTALISVAICIVSVITSVASQTWYVRFTDYHVASVLLLGMVLVEFAALHYDYSLCRLGRQTEAHWSSWWFHAAPFCRPGDLPALLHPGLHLRGPRGMGLGGIPFAVGACLHTVVHPQAQA